MNELELIERIRSRTDKAAYLTRGIGDDCAILTPPPGADLLVTTDLFLEGRHFRRGTMPPSGLGYRALARAMSDIAAMGGTPLAFFTSIVVPEWARGHWLHDFYKGMRTVGKPAGAVLAGGDTTAGEKFVCDVIVLGHAPHGKSLRRDTAKPGDAIYVSGVLGVEAARTRLRFEPRLALGRYLRENCIATACMDLSDGLALDLHRMCVESGVAAELRGPMPVAKKANVEQALTHGEDYELLFTAGARRRVPATFNGIPLTRIGTIVRGKAGAVKLDGEPLAPRGWDPFST
ncbi:MAG: thiamine-phosphate kinase [Acidobacteriota bacterium]